MIFVYIGLALAAIIGVIVLINRNSESEEGTLTVEEGFADTPDTTRVVRTRSGRVFTARLRTGARGGRYRDYDFFDELGELILEDLLMEVIFDTFYSGAEEFDIPSDSQYSDSFSVEDAAAAAVIESELISTDVARDSLQDELAEEAENEVSESSDYSEPQSESESYDSGSVSESVSSPSSCVSESSSSSSSSSSSCSSSSSSCSSSSSSCSSGSSCGSSCGGD